tara:strand:- start:324 stop:554 length:231 start_codon:yes stop_codon:yes gene_type:complete
MQEPSEINQNFYALSKAVENQEPGVGSKIREILSVSSNPSEMRYLEGLLLLLGEVSGELEDQPDFEHDPEEYWEEY